MSTRCDHLRPYQFRPTHNQTETPEFCAWQNMLNRCYLEKHPAYKNYGERGIAVCDQWRHSFEQFFKDMGPKPSPRHSLDRRENEKGYSPENCRWSTKVEQNRNQRKSIYLTVNGIRRHLKEWAVISGVKPGTIYARIAAGWEHGEAVKPVVL